jgi:hypothetical protein
MIKMFAPTGLVTMKQNKAWTASALRSVAKDFRIVNQTLMLLQRAITSNHAVFLDCGLPQSRTSGFVACYPAIYIRLPVWAVLTQHDSV